MSEPKAPNSQPAVKNPRLAEAKRNRKPHHERMVKMGEQQTRFLEEWVKGNSPAVAALRAGYTNSQYGYELSKSPAMIARFQEAKQKYEEAAQTSREKVMGMLQEAFDMAKLQAEPMAMVASAREIGKMCGYYAPVERRIKIEGNVVLDKMNKLSDQELLELVGQANEHIANVVSQMEEEDHHDTPPALAGPPERHSGDEGKSPDPRDSD